MDISYPEEWNALPPKLIRTRGVHISMGKFQNGFLKKHIAVPGCILLPEHKYVRVERFDPGK